MLNISAQKNVFFSEIDLLLDEGNSLLNLSNFSLNYTKWETRIRDLVKLHISNKYTTLEEFNSICSVQEFNPLISGHRRRKNSYNPKATKVKKITSFLENLRAQVEQYYANQSSKNISDDGFSSNLKIFIVHGHDNHYKHEISRLLQEQGLSPIILHEQPNLGKTIIEKFETYSEVKFAIILLTADDVGNLKDEAEHTLNPRARQNVILEMGYFIGKLGRENVVILYSENIELPSDVSGLIHTPFDKDGMWKFRLLRELKGANFSVTLDGITF